VGSLYSDNGELDSAIAKFQEGLELSENLKNQKMSIAIRNNIANILRIQGDLDGAVDLYQKSILIAEKLGDNISKAQSLHQLGILHQGRQEYSQARQYYAQSLEIKERLGDQQGKSATLHAMANIYVTRGDLEGAMGLYAQSLEIQERLGDQKGKSATLAMLAQVLVMRKDYEGGLRDLLLALQTLLKIGARPDAEKVTGIIAGFRNSLGSAQFDPLWHQLTGETVPGWLSQSESDRQGQGLSLEQWVDRSVRAARKKLPEAEGLFNLAKQIAADPQAPAEVKALANVLRIILAGDFAPDLSALPEGLRELVQKALEESAEGNGEAGHERTRISPDHNV
jgi:tetratricopeptide (TPR) repeat protein